MISSSPGQPRALLLDLDDTIIDRRDALAGLNRYWYRILDSEHRPTGEDAFVSSMFDNAGRFSSTLQLYEWMIRIWPGSFPDPETALARHEAVMPDMVRMSAQTREMMQKMRGAGVPIGVVTNGSAAMQWAKVRKTGVDGLVDAVVVSEEFGAEKPDATIFEHALGLIGVDAADTLFVGDNPDADIGGARGAGMLTAWLHHGRQWPIREFRPDYELDAVWEVSGLFGP